MTIKHTFYQNVYIIEHVAVCLQIKRRITYITRTCMYVVEVKYYMYTCIYGLAFLRTFGNMHS